MARRLRDYLSFGGRRAPPQPPAPDYSESELRRAYRLQKSLDFEDPYGDADGDADGDGDRDARDPQPGPPARASPRRRLLKVDADADAAGARELEVDPEYADPLDAQPPAGLGPRLPPDDAYVEPYDAQRAGSEVPSRAVQLYDTPYEGQPPAQRPQHSRMPPEDERPADEYDQPWEWKKGHISRAFAVQFDGPEWERTPGAGRERRRPPPRSPQPAERVDPALPLEKQPWFHGPLSRADAENLLSLCKEGSYLVRLSETSPQDCSLSLRSSQGFVHLKFARTREDQVVLGLHSGPFASVPELVLHYSARPLPVQGAQHLALLHPVPPQGP